MEAAVINREPGLSRDQPRALAEVLVVVGLMELELWSFRTVAPGWLNALVYGAIVLVAWFAQERRRKAGFVTAWPMVGIGRAWFEVLMAGLILTAVLMVAAGLVGDSNETFEFFFLDKPPLKLAQWGLGKFAAAFGQQLALQWFLWPACFEITRSRPTGTMLAASIFGLIHMPSPTLVAITLLAGLVWIALYQRTGRLAPLVVSHMILATLAHGALPERLSYDMRVGSAALDDIQRFDGLNDPKARLINRRLKRNRTSVKRYSSPDYYQAQGGTMPGLIRGLFRDILEKPATESDVAYWMSRRLASPQSDLVNILLASDEYDAIREAKRSIRDGQPVRR